MDSLSFARPVFPLPVEVPDGWSSLGLSPLLRTASLPVWPLGWGQVLGHSPGGSFSSAPLSDATACRTPLISTMRPTSRLVKHVGDNYQGCSDCQRATLYALL